MGIVKSQLLKEFGNNFPNFHKKDLNNAKKIIIEIDEHITSEVKQLAKYFYPKMSIEIIKDLAEKDRIIAITE